MREAWAPFLGRQRGFKGLITLQARDDPAKFMHLTMWDTEADIETYLKERLRPGAPRRLPVVEPKRPAEIEMFEVIVMQVVGAGKPGSAAS